MSRVKMDPELRPLKPQEREFVDAIVSQGLSKVDAYCLVYNVQLTPENKSSIGVRVNRLYNMPHVNAYYESLIQKAMDKAAGKSAWTRELATEKLMNLAEQAEKEIYEQNKGITMSRLNAIVLPIKELNTMHQFNTASSIDVQGSMVQIIGGDNLED